MDQICFVRNRQWRRYKSDLIYKKRLKRLSGVWWYRFQDLNKIRIQHPMWWDRIGLKSFNYLRHTTTKECDTKNKMKWGKSKRKCINSFCKKMTREKFKRDFLKEMRDYGYL